MSKICMHDSKIKKFLIILFTSLILLIPSGFISSLVENRIEYKNEAVENISKSWADSQVVDVVQMSIDGKKLNLASYEIKLNIETELRKKGVFKIPVYTALVTQKGVFENTFGNISNKNLITKIGISDSRGFIDEPKFNINNSGFKSAQDVVFKSNLTTKEKSIPFEITYKIRGLNSIYVGLGGKKNEIFINGNWKNPSFKGDFLPIERKVSSEEFSAHWNIPQIAISREHCEVGVSLLVLNDNYSFAKKSLKYAFLLLSLIFTGYFIFEISSRSNNRIHPIQYCLLGVALLLFYLLLISFSEILPFDFAYFISMIMICFLIFTYTYFVITKRKYFKFSFGITSLILLLYLFFYVLLKAQDAALLFGSLGLFIVLSFVMYLTRNVDWYSEKT